MLKAAIEKILSMSEPHVLEIGGETYADKKLDRIPHERTACPLEVHTLTAILDYITTGCDELEEDTDRKFIIHVADQEHVNLYHELNRDKARECLLECLDYITTGCDELEEDTDRKFIIHVADQEHVNLYHELNRDKARECLLECSVSPKTFPFGRWLGVEDFIIAMQAHFVPGSNVDELNRDKARECLLECSVSPKTFPFGRWLGVEDFIIAMQAHFVPGSNVDALVKLVGNIVDENSVTTADDGVSQKVTARSGISLVKQIEVPNPISLAPYRTFNEIPQPESTFVFRVRRGAAGVEAALFTADGNAWVNDAVLGIRDYLTAELPAEWQDEVIILA